MTRWINKLNKKHYNRKRVKRIMEMLGIKSVIRRKESKYKKSTAEITAANILARDFYASKPNEKWATDVTEFKVMGSKKKLFLSAIIDLYDRSIVSYIVSNRNDNNLVFQTYEQAIQKNPGATPILHSDRGFQYTSKVFQAKLKEATITQSMSRVGRCIDNGPIEGFWGIIKSEMYYLKNFYSLDELKAAIDDFISFYNNERLQERFNDMTPMEVRTKALESSEEPVQYPIPENKRIQMYHAKLKSQQESYANA